MPHHVRAQDIAIEARRPHLVSYMDQVRRALLDPSLLPRSRARLQARLDRLRSELRPPPATS